MRRLFSPCARLARDQRGTAAVEFGFLAPLLCFLAAGVVDSSRLIVRTMQVRAAAQAGADYALRNPTWDSAKVAAAVAATQNPGITASPAPSIAQQCVNNGKREDTTLAVCADHGTPGRFVTVSAQGSFSPVFPWPRLVIPTTLTARALVRLP